MRASQHQVEGSLRTCMATGQQHAPQHMLRFVAGPHNEPFPDYAAKLPGRGAWLLPTAQNYTLAVKKKLFQRHLQTTQPAPDWATIQAQLTARALQALGLAKRANQLAIGADICLEQRLKIQALIMASNASSATAEKLAGFKYSQTQLFTKSQLEQALGIPNCTVVGLLRLDTAWPAVQKAAIAHSLTTESTAAHDRPNPTPSA